MKIAITGGTGFVGSHLARALLREGHHVMLIARGVNRGGADLLSTSPNVSFTATDLSDPEILKDAFAGCDAVAHCAGINREIGPQTYERVHVAGTKNVVIAARAAAVAKIVLLSFLRARPDCGSGYHESKWEAEEIIRRSGLDYTIVKAGVIYGRGDHMLDHLTRSFFTQPLLATVGLRTRPIRPLAIDDLVRVLGTALVDRRLSFRTLALTGPEQLSLADAVRRVAAVLEMRAIVFPMPVCFHYALAFALERLMTIPLVSIAQVRILSEGIVEAAGEIDPLPGDLAPRLRFSAEQIRRGLPAPEPFGIKDLRCCA